tara:strand:- start:434 stop:859 length:426 start_codon:yes stop_codon:yes gene_type:complete
MEGIVNKNEAKLYKANMLFKTIKQVTGLSKEVLLSKDRKKEIAVVRSILGYMLYREIGFTSTDTAKIIERDHSTVVYYGKMFDENYHYYKEYRDSYNLITESFWSKNTANESEEIDLQVKSLQSLIEKLKERSKNLLIKNH